MIGITKKVATFNIKDLRRVAEYVVKKINNRIVYYGQVNVYKGSKFIYTQIQSRVRRFSVCAALVDANNVFNKGAF